MVNHQLKLKRRFKNRLKVYTNIKKSIMRKQEKFIVKLNNTNKHLYIRLFSVGNNKPIVTVHTVSMKKQEENKGKYTALLIDGLVDSFCQQVSKSKVKLLKENIIWDLNSHRNEGRVKLAIDTINKKIN